MLPIFRKKSKEERNLALHKLGRALSTIGAKYVGNAVAGPKGGLVAAHLVKTIQGVRATQRKLDADMINGLAAIVNPHHLSRRNLTDLERMNREIELTGSLTMKKDSILSTILQAPSILNGLLANKKTYIFTTVVTILAVFRPDLLADLIYATSQFQDAAEGVSNPERLDPEMSGFVAFLMQTLNLLRGWGVLFPNKEKVAKGEVVEVAEVEEVVPLPRSIQATPTTDEGQG